MFCKNCGQQISENQSFCPSCGANCKSQKFTDGVKNAFNKAEQELGGAVQEHHIRVKNCRQIEGYSLILF